MPSNFHDHEKVLRIAYIYLDQDLWDGNGVFDVVEKLHAQGLSFGTGELRFNRTLDIFYLAQIAAGIYRSSNQLDDDFPSADDFDAFYARHHHLLSQDAWTQYYSPTFLAQATTARFYRLPDLQDLPDSSDPLAQPRQHKGTGHFTRLPRWAYHVVRTRRRQPALPVATITQLALSTLQQTIARLREDGHRHLSVQPYSETQARFWLKHMKMDPPGAVAVAEKEDEEEWNPDRFGVDVAQGAVDVWAWEAHYSRERWNSAEARTAPLEPDRDGTRKSEVDWCGWPDGGVGVQAWWRGWEPEVGSEEEISFLAAVAVKETEEGVDLDVDVGHFHLDYAMRSHVLLGVLRAAFEESADEREKQLENLKRGMVEAGRIDDERKAEQWIQNVLMVMQPYVQKHKRGQERGRGRGRGRGRDDDNDAQRPADVEDRSSLLRHILQENGQLFARWRLSPVSKEFDFELNPRK